MNIEKTIEYLQENKYIYFESETRRVIHEWATDIAIEALKNQLPEIKGCWICNDTSNDRYYKNQKYSYCPHCGERINLN